MTGFLDILGWPIKVVDAIRLVLLNVNIQLPALLAQALVCSILILIAYSLIKKAQTTEATYIKLAAFSVVAACVIGVLSIIYVWVDYVIWPRNKEIVGTMVFSPGNKPSIELVDNLGQSLGSHADIDAQGNFYIRLSPSFADPPATLKVSQAACISREYRVRRENLLGELMQINWRCDAP